MDMKTLIVIPTYNELQALPLLLAALESSGVEADLLFVDDNSPDGTADLIRSWQIEKPYIHLLSRAGKQGLGTAYLAGFAWGLEQGYEAIVQMDADLSHDPRHLPEMLAALEEGGLVIGSRYVAGGGVENWPKSRQLISRGGSLYARTILGLKTRDLTGGYNAWHHQALRNIDLANIKSNGYSFQIEMKHQAHQTGAKVREVPIIFRERADGQSKMSKKIFLEAMWRVWIMLLDSRRFRVLKKFIKFCLVGVTGLSIDLGSLVLMVEYLHWNLYVANLISFILAVTNNFYLNKRWTFRNDDSAVISQYVKFSVIALIGLGINFAGLYLLVNLAHLWYVWAKLIIAVAVAIWNFVGNHYWTFRAPVLVENLEPKDNQ